MIFIYKKIHNNFICNLDDRNIISIIVYMVDVLKDYAIKVKKEINALTNEQLEKITDQFKKFNIYNASEKLHNVDNELSETIGMIQHMHDYITKKLNNTTGAINNIPTINEELFNILDKKFMRTANNLLLSKNVDNTPINVMREIFYMFLKDKPDMENKTITEIEQIVSIDIEKSLVSLNKLQDEIDVALINVNEFMETIRISVLNNYEPSQISFASSTIAPNLFEVSLKMNTLNKLIIGYDGMITEQTIVTISNTYEHIQIDENEKKFVDQLKNYKTNLITILNKDYDVPFTQIGGQALMDVLYKFNFELQQIQRKIGIFVEKWNEYQQLKLRYYNYFLYQIYSLVSDSNKQIYLYINKKYINYYLSIFDNITMKFTMTTTLEEPYKEYIKYFNVYHYYTIKKLRKFFKFLSETLTEEQVIDIMHCNEDVVRSFTLFNQFRNIIEEYAKDIGMENIEK